MSILLSHEIRRAAYYSSFIIDRCLVLQVRSHSNYNHVTLKYDYDDGIDITHRDISSFWYRVPFILKYYPHLILGSTICPGGNSPVLYFVNGIGLGLGL